MLMFKNMHIQSFPICGYVCDLFLPTEHDNITQHAISLKIIYVGLALSESNYGRRTYTPKYNKMLNKTAFQVNMEPYSRVWPKMGQNETYILFRFFTLQ